ncbi:MAG: aminotransferase class I/II-fold pyridoxal phosphate-dependent enzyme, partial [Spirochaetaceae bacterium]|nr:aminotransferase class I/II-fold pyridoxal phosphate-dependent enzyme [Spirochaetaceae bacterium]
SVKDVLKNSASKFEFYMNYPPSYPREVERSLAECNNIDSNKISIGVGASELIDRLIRMINPKQALLLSPCFSEYERCLKNQESQIIYHKLSKKNNFCVETNIYSSIDKLGRGDIFFICTPNNPNGLLVPLDILLGCIELCENKGIYLVIDISFLDFTKSYDINVLEKDMIIDKLIYHDKTLNKLIINTQYTVLLNTFTKLYSIPSLRIGYCFSNNLELIKHLNKYYVPWSISTLAQNIAITICEDKSRTKWIEDTKEVVFMLREQLIKKLSKFPLTIYKSDANFILFRDNSNLDLIEELLKYDISIRDCSNYRELGKNYYRIAVKNKKENKYLLSVLYKLYGEKCG